MTKDKQILDLLNQGKSSREICNELHVSDRRVTNVRLSGDVSTVTSRSKLSNIQHKYKEALKQIDELNKSNAIANIFRETTKILLPHDFKIKPTIPTDAVANLCLGDWHIDEEVEAKRINNINSFNSKICLKRIESLLASLSDILEMCRSRSNIETLIVYLLGDFISGHIHEELMEDNSSSPIQASLELYEILVGVFDYLLRDPKLKQIIVPCVCGNHSRITKKCRVKTLTNNSLEYLIYQLLAIYYKDSKIKFLIPEGYFCITNVYGFKIRSSHGHYVNFKDGVGGVTIPLNKAIDKWNRAIKVDLDILGHWHQRICMPEFVLNGSLIGYSEFAEKVKAKPEPPSQSFFLTTQKYVKTTEVPIFL